MQMFHATTQPHPAGAPHFELHRSVLAAAVVDAAWGAAWVLFWVVFLLALAQPVGGEAGGTGGAPGNAVMQGETARPDPGSSARGVAPCTPASAG